MFQRGAFQTDSITATTALDISNQALLQLGASKISSFTDTNNIVNATSCNDLWPTVLQAVLRAHPWNGVIKRAQLTVSTTPVWGWNYAFALPADFLRLLEVEDAEEHTIENGYLLANITPINIKYIYLETNIAKFDSLLVSAFIAAMAAELAYPITRSTSQQDTCWKIFTGKLQLARMVDAQEDSPSTLGDFPLLQNR